MTNYNRHFHHSRDSFEEQTFRSAVDRALEQVDKLLDQSRHPRLAADDPDHQSYDDKYALADFLGNTAVAAQMNVWERLGMAQKDTLERLFGEWTQQQKTSVTLRFQADQTCQFFKEQEVTVQRPSPRTTETETTTTTTANPSSSGFFGGPTKTEKKTTTTTVRHTVKELHWKVNLSWELSVYPGTDPSQAISLERRASSTIIVTTAATNTSRGAPPFAPQNTFPPIELNLTWFLQQISWPDQVCQFAIDRNIQEGCKTPRRNPQVDAAMAYHQDVHRWTNQVLKFWEDHVEHKILDKHQSSSGSGGSDSPHAGPEVGARYEIHGLKQQPTFNGKIVTVKAVEADGRVLVEAVNASSGLPPSLRLRAQSLVRTAAASSGESPPSSTLRQIIPTVPDQVFGPIVPVLENGSVLGPGDVNTFLQEQCRSLDQALEDLTKSFPPRPLVKLVSVVEASVVVLAAHLRHLATQYCQGVNYIEDMLRQQLVQAIGHEVTSRDLNRFMRFHYAKLYGETFMPRPFSHPIRLPNHTPDGIISISKSTNTMRRFDASDDEDDGIEMAETFVRSMPSSSCPPLWVPIDAATKVEINGDRYLHGWMMHRFEGSGASSSKFELTARARQFSGFLLMLGKMAGPNQFNPKQAILIQNKDEVIIPLLLDMLPTSKEFKDAVASLSPEQRAFAEDFRRMQLESSVFGVCVVQLKPQLEKVLDLPTGALTKEIQLTQDLLSLFVDYQIPTDLLSFDGPADATREEKLNAVREHVQTVLNVIETSKEKQLVEEERKADMRAETQYAVEMDADDGVAYAEGSFGGAPVMQAAAMAPPAALMARSAPGPQRRLKAAVPMQDSYASNAAPTKKVSHTKRSDIIQSRPSFEPSTPTTDFDVTMIPKVLDGKLDTYDSDHAVRSTIVKASTPWTRKRKENLLLPTKTSTLQTSDIRDETKKAFDLLDAISRSGSLPIEKAELHLVVAASHCFDKSVMGTVIRDNINPIEKIERSSLLLASSIHGEAPQRLLADAGTQERLALTFPSLFNKEGS